MQTVLIVIHLMIVVALVTVVLLQRSEGGALGIGGGGGGNFMSARGAANALTRTTAVLAAAFFATSIGLGILAGLEDGNALDNLPLQNQQGGTGEGILDQLPGGESLNLGGDEGTSSDEPQVPTSQ